MADIMVDPGVVEVSVSTEQKTSQEQLIAGKYTSEEELNKGISELLKGKSVDERVAFYKSLESQQGKAPQNPSEPKSETPPAPGEKLDPTPPTETTNPPPVDASQIQPLDMNKYMKDYFDNQGKLSEDSYKELQDKYKVPKETVDRYIEGEVALAEQFNSKIVNRVGGEQTFSQMMAWAAAPGNLSVEEVQSFNDTIEQAYAKRDLAQVSLAMEGLKAKYIRANGSNPNLLNGETGPTSPSGYQSRAEMVRDMRDPLYKSDPAFRQKVAERIKHTSPGVI